MNAPAPSGPEVGRFAPSTTGPAHPGTLLAALLCWLDARSRGARLLLRLEDLDPERCRPEWSEAMARDLDWFGLDWDEVAHQRSFAARHDAALDALAAAGRLYPCGCTRARIRAHGEPAADGGFRYPGWCRGRALPDGGWRESGEPLRVRLPAGPIALRDESGLDLSGEPAAAGDPVVRRRDGALAYLLGTVVDDAASGVTRVVRGRDLAATTLPQVALQRLLGLAEPRYRHHLLLLEEQGEDRQGRPLKLAKFHGAVGIEALRVHYDAPALCGVLAHAAGLRDEPAPVTPTALLEDFRWESVGRTDRLLRVQEGGRLVLA